MGFTVIYTPYGSKTSGSESKFPDIAHAYLNFPGFIREFGNNDAVFYFSFIVYSVYAEMYTVTFSIPLSKEPISC